jgi:hypothetical protein
VVVVSTPHTLVRQSMSQPIRSLEAFTHAHMEAKSRIESYLWLGRKNSKKLNQGVDYQLKAEAAKLLFSNNAYARIAFAKCVVRRMTSVMEMISSETPTFFVTLTPVEFAVNLDEKNGFNVRRLTRWVGRALKGLNCLGMVEAALYTNIRRIGRSWTPIVSWHVHLIVWGTSYATLNRRLAKIRENHQSLIEGIEAAHSVRLESGSAVEEELYYMLKSPLKEYRIAKRRPRGGFDHETREISESNGFKQWKRDLRPGHLVQMCNVMQEQYLDNLLFGIGDGVAIHKSIKDEMLQDYRRLIRMKNGYRFRRN